jgi:hypothetical protein
MSAVGQGNNEEYLIHIIAIKCLLEQKETVQAIGKAFQAVVKVWKQLELLLEAPKGKTKTKKDEQRKKLSAIKKDFKAAHKLAGAETLKAYELFRCFVLVRHECNGTTCQKCTARTPG